MKQNGSAASSQTPTTTPLYNPYPYPQYQQQYQSPAYVPSPSPLAAALQAPAAVPAASSPYQAPQWKAQPLPQPVTVANPPAFQPFSPVLPIPAAAAAQAAQLAAPLMQQSAKPAPSQGNFADQRLNRQLIDRLGGNFTSDHTWQSIAVQLYDQQNRKAFQEIRGASWNMMDKCHSKAQHRQGLFANNPFDLSEDATQHKARKELQLEEIKYMMRDRDFILLQEVDWAHNPQLKQLYTSTLAAQGWGIIETQPPAKGTPATQQHLITLYNTQKLTPVSAPQGIFPAAGGKCRAMVVDFNFHPNGPGTRSIQVTLGNLHLDYNHDYRKEILEFQRNQVRQNKWTIMGGDTNHAQNDQSEGLIGNWNYATNISENNGQVGIAHKGGKQVKRYDGFFVSPTTNTYAIIEETEGKYFMQKQPSGELMVSTLDPSRLYPTEKLHQTWQGEPWRRQICVHRDKELEKLMQNVGIAANVLPEVVHPKELSPNATKMNIDVVNGSGLVFLKFANSADAQQFVQKAAGVLGGKTKACQGQDGNMVSFSTQNAQKLGIDMQRLCGPLLKEEKIANNKQMTVGAWLTP